MPLDYTKYYLLTVEDSDREDLLKETPRDLSGSYRVDNDIPSGQYIYNEDIGISEWGLETPMPTDLYPELPDIWSACYGKIHDYRYDATDGTDHMEFVREVKSAANTFRYFFVVRCKDPDYIPSQSISRYMAAWDDESSWTDMEVDYEKLILNFCYTNPYPDIYKLYQLPWITPEDWGKYLHVSTVDGKLEWAPVDPSIDLQELLERLSQISGIPADSHPVIPCIASEAFSPGPHTLFSANLAGFGNAHSSIDASVLSGGRVSADNSSLFNAAWALDDDGFIVYLVFDFPVIGFPEDGAETRIDIGSCEFKHALIQNGDPSGQCVLDSFVFHDRLESDYIYVPGNTQLFVSGIPVSFHGARGQIAIRPSRLSSEIRAIPFEFRLSLSIDASDDEENE